MERFYHYSCNANEDRKKVLKLFLINCIKLNQVMSSWIKSYPVGLMPIKCHVRMRKLTFETTKSCNILGFTRKPRQAHLSLLVLTTRFPPVGLQPIHFWEDKFMIGAWQPSGLDYWSLLTTANPTQQKSKNNTNTFMLPFRVLKSELEQGLPTLNFRSSWFQMREN